MKRLWHVVLPALVALALPISIARAQVDFDTGRAFRAFGDGRSLSLADVDEDGRLDVIVSGRPGILVHAMHDPFGPALRPFEWQCFGIPSVTAAGDVDADGHADVVIAVDSGGSTEVGVYFGDGRGGATYHFVTMRGGDVSSLALLDSDGDSLLDIVAAFDSSRTIVLVRQDRAAPRSFLPATLAPAGGASVRLATGDFNGDGTPDVAAAAGNPLGLHLLSGDGAGSFSGSRSFWLNQRVHSIVAGDFDRDGLDDLLLTDSRLFSMRGDPVAGFVPGWTGPQEPTFFDLAAGDLDGDGDLDLASSGSSLQTWLGDGAGSFVFGVGFDPERTDGALAIGDVDGDGVADVVGARHGVDVVDVLLRTAEGEFVLPTALDGPMNGYGAAFDANGDGTLDLVFAGYSAGGSISGRAYLFFGNGSGGFLPRGVARLRSMPARLVAADVVGDSFLDLVVTNDPGFGVTVLRNDGPGTFTDLGDVFGSPTPVESAVGDFDGDGAMDIATGERLNPSFGVAFGNGAGLFVPTTSPAPSPQYSIAAGDVDADGFGDVALATVVPPGLVLGFGSGSRAFTFGAPIGFGQAPGSLAIVDVDRDGNLDVLVGDLRASFALIFFGDGARGFPRTLALPTIAPPESLSLGDATGDGIDDLVAAHGEARAFSVLPGDGRGGFLPAQAMFQTIGDASQAFATDVGEDGVAEVVVPGNDGPASFCRPRETPLAVAMRGTVDVAQGVARDVLFVNGRSGGSSRTVRLRATDPLAITVVRPPAVVGLAAFAMYAWPAVPTTTSLRVLQQGLGTIVLPMPLAPGSPAPREIWNSAGRRGALGAPTRPSSPAPTTLESLPNGARRVVTFTLQGLIVDPGAPNGRAAVTNGVVVEVR